MASSNKNAKIYDFTSTDILIYIWEKRNILGLITLAAAVLSVVVSFTITPLFRSVVVLFPTASASISKNLLSDSYGGRYTIYEIGEENQAEQLMQVLNSEEIKDRIIRKYNLLEHYGIEPDSKFPRTQLDAAYKSRVRFRRTEFMSVQIIVMDKDPVFAAGIANDIAAFTDTVFHNILKQRAMDAFELVEKEYNELLVATQETKDSLDVLRSLGIHNYSTQAERYHEAYGKALVSGNTNAIKTMEEKFRILSKYGGTYDILANQLNYQVSVLSRLKQRYVEAKVEAEQTLPHKFVVDQAFIAEKKAYPKKSIIVIVSTLSAFLFGLILLIIRDNLKSKVL